MSSNVVTVVMTDYSSLVFTLQSFKEWLAAFDAEAFTDRMKYVFHMKSIDEMWKSDREKLVSLFLDEICSV